jgi:hypothetical protein
MAAQVVSLVISDMTVPMLHPIACVKKQKRLPCLRCRQPQIRVGLSQLLRSASVLIGDCEVDMRKVISLNEIVELLELEEGNDEVCATAEAGYSEAIRSLVVRLDSFVRPVDLLTAEQNLTPGWLPRSDTVRETVLFDEAVPLARDIFKRWVEKVRQSIPSPLNLKPVERL